jgi:DNA-binding GntR family transcriptional regulator
VAEIVESDRLPQVVGELHSALDKLEAATGDVSEQLEADLAFHAQLCASSGNSILLDTWRHLEGPIRVVVLSASTENRRFPMSAGHHRPIVEAIERGDADTAVRVLREHMQAAVTLLNSKN